MICFSPVVYNSEDFAILSALEEPVAVGLPACSVDITVGDASKLVLSHVFG